MGKRPARRQIVPRERVKDVHAHAHLKRILWLFLISCQDVRIVAEDQHAEIDLHLARIRGDRRGRVALAMKGEHLAVVEGRQNIAIDHEHRIARAVQERQAAGGPQRRCLSAIRQPRTELLPSPQNASISSVR